MKTTKLFKKSLIFIIVGIILSAVLVLMLPTDEALDSAVIICGEFGKIFKAFIGCAFLLSLYLLFQGFNYFKKGFGLRSENALRAVAFGFSLIILLALAPFDKTVAIYLLVGSYEVLSTILAILHRWLRKHRPAETTT